MSEKRDILNEIRGKIAGLLIGEIVQRGEQMNILIGVHHEGKKYFTELNFMVVQANCFKLGYKKFEELKIEEAIEQLRSYRDGL